MPIPAGAPVPLYADISHGGDRWAAGRLLNSVRRWSRTLSPDEEESLTSRLAMRLSFILTVVGLVALPHAAGAERGIRVGQAAPEITGGPWVNSTPLSLGGLRGRVVFVEFWTYG